MRALAPILSVSIASCSMMGGPSQGPNVQRLDPTKIYLGRSIVTATRRELDRFACVNTVVLCQASGGTFLFECRCPLP